MSKSLKKELNAQSVIDLTTFQKQANERKIPDLDEAIRQLRPVLQSFTEHDFAGVPGSRKLVIQSQINQTIYHYQNRTEASFIRLQGKWMQPLGFWPGGRVHVIAQNGLIIICPGAPTEEQIQANIFAAEFNAGKEAV